MGAGSTLPTMFCCQMMSEAFCTCSGEIPETEIMLELYCNPLALGRDLAYIIITRLLSSIYAWSLMSATGYTSMNISSTWQFFSNCKLASSILPPPTIWVLAQFVFWPHPIAWHLAPGPSLSYQSPSCFLPVNAHHYIIPQPPHISPHTNKATPRWSLVNVRPIEVPY